MKEIKWYIVRSGALASDWSASSNGLWAARSDVEALQAELRDSRALALAAIRLVPEDTTMGELSHLCTEAIEVFLGKDKQTIAKLQDEVRNLQEGLRRVQRPPCPGVNAVYGVKPNDKTELRYSLMLTSVHRASNGGLEIEVQLP